MRSSAGLTKPLWRCFDVVRKKNSQSIFSVSFVLSKSSGIRSFPSECGCSVCRHAVRSQDVHGRTNSNQETSFGLRACRHRGCSLDNNTAADKVRRAAECPCLSHLSVASSSCQCDFFCASPNACSTQTRILAYRCFEEQQTRRWLSHNVQHNITPPTTNRKKLVLTPKSQKCQHGLSNGIGFNYSPHSQREPTLVLSGHISRLMIYLPRGCQISLIILLLL